MSIGLCRRGFLRRTREKLSVLMCEIILCIATALKCIVLGRDWHMGKRIRYQTDTSSSGLGRPGELRRSIV